MSNALPKKRMSPEEIIELLSRTAEEMHSKGELIEKLKSGRPLRMKYGVDLTAPFLHIGHAVNLWMYRSLQELGHKLVFLLGDFTTTIGDPTGRSKTRPVLSKEEIAANGEEFLRQVKMVLLDDPEVFEVRRNSEWFGKMPTSEFLSLISLVSHERLIARDMFQRRIEQSLPIFMHEMMYPILQGYDSVMLDADLTIIGSDQLFNEMMGRMYQEKFGKPPQVLITSVLTPGIDGKEKQSKSLGNYIGLGHSPRDKFGRVMSIPDDLIEQYARIYTTLPLDEVAAMSPARGGNPMASKKKLARAIVARYHGEAAGLEEERWFTETFSKRETPEDVPLVSIGADSIELLKALKVCLPDRSNSELRRLIEQGGVSLGGAKLSDPNEIVSVPTEGVLQVGKRNWFKLAK